MDALTKMTRSFKTTASACVATFIPESESKRESRFENLPRYCFVKMVRLPAVSMTSPGSRETEGCNCTELCKFRFAADGKAANV